MYHKHTFYMQKCTSPEKKHLLEQKGHENGSYPGLETKIKVKENVIFKEMKTISHWCFSFTKSTTLNAISLAYLELSKFEQIYTRFCILWIAFNISKVKRSINNIIKPVPNCTKQIDFPLIFLNFYLFNQIIKYISKRQNYFLTICTHQAAWAVEESSHSQHSCLENKNW